MSDIPENATWSFEDIDENTLSVQAYDPADGPDSMPILDLEMDMDDFAHAAKVWHAKRLEILHKEEVDISAKDIQVGDVIGDLGFRVENVLTGSSEEIVVQDYVGAEVTMAPNRQITVLRNL